MSKKKIFSIILTIIWTTFILTNIYAQEDMLMVDFMNFMIPVIIPWAIYFIWKALKKKD